VLQGIFFSMKFHKEGYPSLLLALVFAIAVCWAANYFIPDSYYLIRYAAYFLAAVVVIIILQFFRSPKRAITIEDMSILCPADGKVVVIEEVEEPEYFKGKRLQISVFMSPINVHVNRYPISGIVKYVKYHPGKYLVAWHPKSSTDNERTTVVVQHENGAEVLFRQIAGALARRIVFYCKENDPALQGSEFGFIKFGSRVDLLLPVDVKVKVELNQVVKGGKTILAQFE
jgi:phosphatidylserine decarboxylase